MKQLIVLILLTVLVALPTSAALADNPYPGAPTPAAPAPVSPMLPELSSGQLAMADVNDVWVMVSNDGYLWFVVFDALPNAQYWGGYQRHNGDMASLMPPDETVSYEYTNFTYYGFYSNPDVGPPWYGYWLWLGGQLIPGKPKASDSEVSVFYGYQYVDVAYLEYGLNLRNATNLTYLYRRYWSWLPLLLGTFASP